MAVVLIPAFKKAVISRAQSAVSCKRRLGGTASSVSFAYAVFLIYVQ